MDARSEEWESISNPLAREDQRRYGGAPWEGPCLCSLISGPHPDCPRHGEHAYYDEETTP